MTTPRLPLAALALLLSPIAAKAQTIDFNRDVRPILADYCFACHGPDEKKRKADLRLDVRADALAAKAFVPGKPAESALLKRVLSADAEEVMPPPATGKKLTPAQIEVLRKWIAGGAEYRDHWAFIPPTRPPVPTVRDRAWVKNPLDAFVLARLEREGLKPSPEADKVTLIRRVTLDLTGLPPTPAEVDAFLADKSPDAYEKLVERLLGSPRYGERMALDWLDAARFADTHGYHIDSGRNMTPFRDYVIKAYNSNLPFDRFTIEQLAGDLLPDATLEQKIASGFNRNHMINFEGGAIPEEYHTAYVVDRVTTTATVWMGLTMVCSQCHDHKFDPFTQKDFYRLYAFFNNVPENGLDGQKGNATPVLKVPTPDQEKKLAQLKAAITALEKKMAGPMPEVDAAQAKWEQSPGASKTEWTVLDPLKPRSKGGAVLKVQDDKSVRAEGPNPATETYTVALKSDLPKVTAIRLEALADDSFPAKGPGRGVNGNFVMTGIRVTLGDGADAKVIAVKGASADASQKEGNFDVGSVLKKGPGWAILPEVGKDHAAVFEFAEPVEPAGKEIVVQLQFNSIFAGHQIGRFRLAATGSPTPHLAAGTPANIAAILKTDPEKRTEKQAADLRTYYRGFVSPEVRKLNEELAALKNEVVAVERSVPDVMVMSDAKPRDTHVLIRGAYDKKGDKVTAGTPASLPPMPKDAPASRLGLARWLVADDHPLTARVIVNRDWQRYFGTGLVKTAEDFGVQGEFPSHPELLDWLASEFRQPTWGGRQAGVSVPHPWDVKHIQRLIVTSATYRQASRVTPELQAKDPENRLLARQSRLRLQAEFIRDGALFASGLLNGEIGGKSVSPYQPKGIWEELAFRQDNANFSAQVYVQGKGKDLYRRTMYTFWKRTAPPPALVTLDAPDREICTVRRPRTNTPLQALVLMNDPTYVEASRKLAERMMTEAGDKAEDRITFAFRFCTARTPTEKELAVLRRLFDAQLGRFRGNKDAALKLLAVGESPRDDKLDPAELAAWSLVAAAVLNLDETITRN